MRSAHGLTAGAALRVTAALGVLWLTVQGFRLLHSQHHRCYPAAFSHTEEGAIRRLLIVGDGTGVGIGSADPRSTVPGRLSAAFPGTEIVNHARIGARSADLVAQIAASTGRFDLILIFAGAGDAMRLRALGPVARAAERALEAACSRSDCVAVLPPADIGIAPVWLWPLNAWLTHRARRVRHAWQWATRERTGVHLVELRLPRHRDPFRLVPRRFFSADGMHPSEEGYALWFAQITRQVPFFAHTTNQPIH